MSDLEVEQAAIAPHRWIELCGPGAILRPRTTRSISDVARSFLFLVPGGRYLVGAGRKGLFVWDLGYVSNPDCTLIASDGPRFALFCTVQATPDDMGLVILVFNIKG